MEGWLFRIAVARSRGRLEEDRSIVDAPEIVLGVVFLLMTPLTHACCLGSCGCLLLLLHACDMRHWCFLTFWVDLQIGLLRSGFQ